MRKLVFLFFIILTGYMAGVFRSASLMVLAAMEAVLFVCAFLQSRYLLHHLSAEVLRHGEELEKSMWLACRIRIRNRGKLPVSRFQVKLRYGYGQDRKTGLRSKYIDGSCGRGESVVQFEISGQYCGLMRLQFGGLRVYDYLGLFSAFRSLDESVEVAVYPPERVLRPESLSLEDGMAEGLSERISPWGADMDNEVRQLREYRPGESGRYIHWNLSARTGLLWVKEYEREADCCIRLYLESAGTGGMDAEDADVYYELLSALVLGLLEQAAAVHVYWDGTGDGGLADMEISHAGQCRELLFTLYRRGIAGPGDVMPPVRAGWPGDDIQRRSAAEPGKGIRPGSAVGSGKRMRPGDGIQPGSVAGTGDGVRAEDTRNCETDAKRRDVMRGDFLKLDPRLRLYQNDTLLCTFSAEALKEQIAEGEGRCRIERD